MTLESINCATVDAGVSSLDDSSKLSSTNTSWPIHNQTNQNNAHTADHFITRNGVEFAGTHIILDLWGAQELDNLALMENALRQAVDAANATLLHIHLHHFTPNGGISGVAVLAESHISVHTWPERSFAAFDVFMCGDAQPEATIPVFKAAFKPKNINISEHLRGANMDCIEPANDQSLEGEHETL